MTHSTGPTGENVYFIDHESGAEMARLLDQDTLLTQEMGGFFSERNNDFSGIGRVLDIGCGPGGWALGLAVAHPQIEVLGIDISPQMIAYAQMQARTRRLDNVQFRVMDVLAPFDFPDDSFDLVNARLMAFLPTTAWPAYLHKCRRIIRPGGIYRETETEMNISNSAALDTLDSIFFRALKAAGQAFAPEGGRHLGIVGMLGRLLRDAAFQHIGHKCYLIEISAGTEAHHSFCKDWKVFYKLMQPFLIQTRVTTREEVDRLYEQMLVEMMLDTFCGVFPLFTVWGEKPRDVTK
ncbi:MAG: methyltransferase domain-containing protein [Ktedonobacteraceae bacterium]|nr:methyltransferase domain-containing protein [Ktedonobacteraceae bacterium]